MSYADQILIQNCRDILDHGVRGTDYQVRPAQKSGAPTHTIKRLGIVNRYDLLGELSMITLRRTAPKSAMDGLLQIWQKKSSNIHSPNSHTWGSWTDENGSTGKACGYQLGVKHHYKGGGFDQVDRVLYDLKYNPLSRRITFNIYNHHDLHKISFYPCAYSMTLNVSGHTLDGILNRHPQDMLTTDSWNMYQYAVLLHIFAQVSGLKAGEPVHVIADVYIYDRHISMVEELLKREPHPGPTLAMDTFITNFYQSTTSGFYLEDYQYHIFGSKVPVAI